jgi:anti-sigma regulatory factor (Ser/Thr protein kinase)
MLVTEELSAAAQGEVTVVSTLGATRLILRNDLAELKLLARWFEDWAEPAISPSVSFAIQLCLEEAVANIIMHGGAENDYLEIAVELERTDGMVVARVEDTGREFDPTQVPQPALAMSLAEAKVGDFGISLMRSFASKLDYERRDSRNRLTLRFVEPPAIGMQTG